LASEHEVNKKFDGLSTLARGPEGRECPPPVTVESKMVGKDV
jgi:hypothetical protein